VSKKPTGLRQRKTGRWIKGGEGKSVTGQVSEALSAGVPILEPSEAVLPGEEADLIRMGDPDVDPIQNEYAGEESPGATTPTPDQNLIDAVGRAYGVADEDNGGLRTSAELLDKRDDKRPGRLKGQERHRKA
jgi:hypothetical protein